MTTISNKLGRQFKGLRDQRGLTLLELLVVLLILGIMALFAGAQVMKILGSAKTDAAQIQVENISSILDLYHLETGSYPTQDQGLDALIAEPSGAKNWNGPYVKKAKMLVDPWGNGYHYRFPGAHVDVDVFSLGADNAEGGEDEDSDVGNW